MIVFLFCLIGQLDSLKPHPTAAAYETSCKDAKQAQIDVKIASIKKKMSLKKSEMSLKNGSNFANEKRRQAALNEQLAAMQEELAAAEGEQNNEELSPLPLFLGRLNVGDIGVPTSGFRVLQVIGDDKILCSQPDGLIIRGVDVKDVVDGDVVEYSTEMFVFGTYKYTNTLGASRKILALEPWKNAAEYTRLRDASRLKHAEKLEAKKTQGEKAALEALEAADARKAVDKQLESAVENAKWRAWSYLGKNMKAKYNGINAGQVKLIKEDGTNIKIPLERCTKEERDWLKKKPWEKVEHPESKDNK